MKKASIGHGGDLLLFEVVARECGYSAAGRLLGLSRSTVSRRIMRLEKRLGSRLFLRDTRRFALTPAGERLLAHCRRLSELLGDIDADMQALADEPSGPVRCATSSTLAARVGGLLHNEFSKTYPEIEIIWDAGEHLVDLVEDNFDLAIRIDSAIDDERLIARRLAPAPIVLAATPEYLARSKPLHSIDDLADHTCIRLTSNTGTWLFHGRDGRPVLHPIEGTLKAGTDAALIEACLNHMGIIYVPRFCLAPYLANGQLRAVLEDAPIERSIFLIYVQRELPLKVRVLVDYLTGLGETSFVEAISRQRLAADG